MHNIHQTNFHWIVKFNYLIIFALCFSCIPHKKLVFFQKNNEIQGTAGDIITYNTQDYNYKLKPGDVVLIQINTLASKYNPFSNDIQNSGNLLTSVDPMLKGYTITDSGYVNLPLMGNVAVSNLSIEEATQKIQRLAGEYFDKPVVKLNLVSFYITMLGEFNRPGRYVAYNNKLTVLDAIALANDFTITANRQRVRVIRTEKNQTQHYFLDITDERIFASPVFHLQPNDVVYVEPLPARSTQFTTANSVTLIGIATNFVFLMLNLFLNSRR